MKATPEQKIRLNAEIQEVEELLASLKGLINQEDWARAFDLLDSQGDLLELIYETLQDIVEGGEKNDHK